MSIFGRGMDPILAKVLLSRQPPVYEQKPVYRKTEPASSALDRVRAKAWDECADEAYYRGWLHEDAVEDVKGRNPYRTE